MEPHWILGAFFLASGSRLVWTAVQQIHDGRRSTRWPTTTGTILRVRGAPGTSAWGRSAVAWNPEYEYEVDSVVYRSMRYDFAGRNAATLWQSFPNLRTAGESVRVYFDPANPAESVLLAGAARGNYVICGIGLLFALLGLLTFLDALGVGVHP